MWRFGLLDFLLFFCLVPEYSFSTSDQNTKPPIQGKKTYTCSDYPKTHSMCLTDRGRNIPLTNELKEALVKQHNKLRGGVNPPAKDMQKMYWDDELAAIAAKWAAQCLHEHDETENRLAKSLPGVSVGQNLGYGYVDFYTCVDAWFSEIKDFEYGIGAVNGATTVGHFSQVVLATASRVGCAKADCTGKINKYKTVYACNYATGQTDVQVKKPYCTGSFCNTCSTKEENLCDCKGRVCFNGGTFDIQSCTCLCYSLYVGDQCETRICPKENQDFSSCHRKENKNACKQFVNWAPEYCAFYCGLCPETCFIKCENGGSVNSVPCTCMCPPGFQGERCEIVVNVTKPTTPSACGEMTCPIGTTLYQTNCYCARNEFDCVGKETEENRSCAMAWCDSLYWQRLCPHTCGKCGINCIRSKLTESLFCNFASCNKENLRAMCPFKCRLC